MKTCKDCKYAQLSEYNTHFYCNAPVPDYVYEVYGITTLVGKENNRTDCECFVPVEMESTLATD